MKKLLCIFLVILTLSVPMISVITQATGSSDTVTADEFAREIGNLVKNTESDGFEYGKYTESADNSVLSEFQSCRLIVKSSSKIDTYGASSVINGYNDLWILSFDSAEETAQAFEYFSTRSGIDYVEPDRPVYALSAENEYAEEAKIYNSWGPEYIGLNNLNNSIEASNIELKETVVAVLDTGTDDSHPAFNGRVVPTGVNTSTSGEANSSSDDNGHGTQVAGVVIDSTLDNVIVKPYKVLDKWGQGTVITLAAGIICAVNDNVDVINMSISLSENSEALKEAILLADRSDIVLVAASGNDSSNTKYYPASYECVIKVGASNESGVIANFSTRGDDVDFAAPGVNIYTTNLGGKFKTVSGTSFASPLVASLAATMISYDSSLSSEDIKDIMIQNAVYVQETDSDLKYGNGIIRSPEFKLPSVDYQKTETPYFSHDDSLSQSEIDLEIFCDTPESVIYYTTDRTVPSKTNPSSIIYDGNPMHISQTTVITAVAYCEGKYRSKVATFASIIVPYLNESDLTIDSSGIITSYLGSKTSFTVPDTVNGITVTGIGESVFEGKNISEIVLPLTVTSIGVNAFKDCSALKTIFAKGVETLSDYAFYNCNYLKNIYLNKLKTIGKYALYSIGSKQYELTGTTVSLDLSAVSSISDSAFQNAAVSDVDLGIVSSIGKGAFLDCISLVSIQIDKLSNLSNEAFKGCTSLSTVEILGLTYISSDAFSGCKSLVDVNIPDATYVNARAFENCVSLGEIYLDSATTVYSTVFNNCTSLRIINVPEMKSFESAVYRAGTTTFPKFSSSLEAFIAPKLTKTSAYMFGSAPNILAVSFKSLSTVADNTFSGCNNMMYLNIQSVTSLSELSLANCKIDFIDARNLQTAAALPDNSGIMLSNNFVEASGTAEALTVYGTTGSLAESFAVNNGYNFLPIPFLYEELPKYINELSGTVTVNAVGFDLTYQWYSNSVNSNENGTPIDGATSKIYTFNEKDTAYYYYCVVTQSDFGVITEYSTDVIIKDPKPANYERYNLAVSDAKKLVPEHYINYEILANELSKDISGKRSCEQRLVDEQAAAIRAAMTKLIYNKATGITLTASKTNLGILQRTKVKITTYPNESVYKSVEWSSDNTNSFVVSKNGTVRCVGRGSAYIIARVTNHDGSVVFGRIKLKSNSSSRLEELLASFYKMIFILISNYQTD